MPFDRNFGGSRNFLNIQIPFPSLIVIFILAFLAYVTLDMIVVGLWVESMRFFGVHLGLHFLKFTRVFPMNVHLSK